MLPMKDLRLSLGDTLAADAGTLAPVADANVIALIKAAFALSEDLVATDLTLADFTGSTPIEGATGAQQVGIDPATLQQMITIKEPAGGWRWVNADAPPATQTIYGYCLLSNDLATLLAAAVLPTPITLTDVNQVVNLGQVNMTFVAQPLT